MRLVTPLGWAASRWSLGERALRWSTTVALVASILIVLTGGIVRVTGSGLGCPTWPTCEGGDVIVPVPDSVHQLIEQTNRLITGAIILAVAWVIVAARLQRPRDRHVTRLAWSQFWLVIVNAVAGGISVLAGLNPWVVALHFVLAMALLATTAITWHRVRWPGGRTAPVVPRTRLLARVLVVLTAVLVVVGTVVSGSGPHSGDSRDVPRIGLDWTSVVWVHAAIATAVILLTVAVVVLAREVRRRAIALLVVLLLQWAVGDVQSLTGLPAALVAIHLLGAALVWVGALRVLLDADPRLFALRTPAVAEKPVEASPAR